MKVQRKQLITADTDAETQALGKQLAQALPPGAVVYLNGPLGAGKTTLVRGLLRGLGYQDKVKSPTYTIVEPYETEKFEVFHFDLYRLRHADELRQIGLEHYFHGGSVCVIEWPELGAPLLPAPDLSCNFAIIESVRHIELTAHTHCGEDILTRL